VIIKARSIKSKIIIDHTRQRERTIEEKAKSHHAEKYETSIAQHVGIVIVNNAQEN
jgi:hypothetical protein